MGRQWIEMRGGCRIEMRVYKHNGLFNKMYHFGITVKSITYVLQIFNAMPWFEKAVGE